MFLNINNNGVAGESQDSKHSKEIDVLAWSWGLSNSGSAQSGSGSGSGKVNCQDISITKYVDSATPKLMLACCKGTAYPSVLLTIRKAGDKPLEYLKFTFTQVIISSISGGGSGGEDRLTENIAMNFAKVQVDYTPQNKDGSGGTAITMNYDFAQNVNT